MLLIGITPQDGNAGSARPGSGSYRVGATVTLEATANPGYDFLWWENSATGEEVHASSFPLTLEGDCQWIAVFRKNGEHFIYFNKPMPGLQADPLLYSYAPGTPVTLSAPAQSGRSIVYEYGPFNGGDPSSVNWTRLGSSGAFIMPAYDIGVRALYSVNMTLTVGDHGTAELSPAGPWYEGDTVTLTVHRDSGYRLIVSNVPPSAVQSGDVITFVLDDHPDLPIVVEFEEIPTGTLSLGSAPEGAGEVSHAFSEDGHSVTLTAVPHDGYHFLAWADYDNNVILSGENP